MDRRDVAASVGSFCLVFLLVLVVEGAILSTPLEITLPVAAIVGTASALLVFYRVRNADRSR